MSIGEQLKRYIRQSGLNQNRIAIGTGISRAAISRFMSGVRGLDLVSIEKLAKYLRLELRQKPPTTKSKGR